MSRHSEFNPITQVKLSVEDQRVLDALIDAEFDHQAINPMDLADHSRLEALEGMLGLLRDYPVDDADETLIYATLARIDRSEEQAAARMSFDARHDQLDGRSARRRIRMPDFIAVAAVILIGVGIGWPLLASMRNRSMDMACANNLRYVGYAFGQYAADNHGALPIAMAGPSVSWDTFKNVLNMEPLVNGNYCEVGHLDCPGHHHQAGDAGPSYSYRWFVLGPQGQAHVGWGTGERVTVVLGDLNPVIEAARSGRFVPPLSMSINHAGRGQNVLVTDGATLWLQEPVVGRGDNIWLPNGAEKLHSGERPADVMDVFLAH